MRLERIFLCAVLISAVITFFVLRRSPGPQRTDPRMNYEERNRMIPHPGDQLPPPPQVRPEPVSTQTVFFPKLKTKLSEFTSAQRDKLEKDFPAKYQPAIQKWCSSYQGHVPFDPSDVTLDKFVERVGRNEEHMEFVFVVSGITLGVEDSRTGVDVDYLNAPQQTRKMALVPDGSAPVMATPVSREEIQQMLQADGWSDTNEWMEIIPTGLSGSLNGGAMVHVGGNPDNGASWKYNLVFGPDGKLAFYLRGLEIPRRK